MKKPRLILIVSFLALFFTIGGSAKAETVLLVADATYPPYMFEDGAHRGIYVDIVREAAKRIKGYEIQMALLPWKRALSMVEEGSALGIIGVYYAPEIRPYLDIYSPPLFEEEVVAYCSTSKIKPKMIYPKDFEGLTFANNTGFVTPGPEFFAMIKTKKIKMEEAPSTEINVRKLTSGRVDCYVNDKISIEKELYKSGDADKVAIAAPVQKRSALIGYSRAFNQPWRNDFIATLNATLTEMQADGSIKQILTPYIH